MTSNLLEKEREYKKLNEELQNRNKKIMEEFDNVMKKQDNLKETNPNKEYLLITHHKSDGDTFQLENKYSTKPKFVPKKYEEKENSEILQNVIPESVDHMGTKGMSVFYKAKIKEILIEREKLQLELRVKCEELKTLHKDNTKLIEEKSKWLLAFNTNKTNCIKLENQIILLNAKCQTKENENASLRKELEQFKKDLKTNSSNITGAELRLSRALEENEKIRTDLKIAKQEEKELKDVHKKELAEITNVTKRLEKQKLELLTAFKKQMHLIDNLKKQKTFLEALKLTQVSENEFMKILDTK